MHVIRQGDKQSVRHSCFHSFTHSFTHAFMFRLIYSFIHAFIHPHIDSHTLSFLTHLFIYLFIHSVNEPSGGQAESNWADRKTRREQRVGQLGSLSASVRGEKERGRRG